MQLEREVEPERRQARRPVLLSRGPCKLKKIPVTGGVPITLAENMYTNAAGTILGWANRNGVVEPLTPRELWETGRLSPDGRRVANGIYHAPGAEGDIRIYDVDRRTRTRLTFEGANRSPIWTPDGRRVTFGASVAGKNGIYSGPVDGSGKPKLLSGNGKHGRARIVVARWQFPGLFHAGN
jgi:hypothetical protein